MRRMIVIPETVYEGLLSNTKNSDPFDKQLEENNRNISKLLYSNIPSDTKNKLYDQNIRQIKSLTKIKPEAKIERNDYTERNFTERNFTEQPEKAMSVKSDDTQAESVQTAIEPTHLQEKVAKITKELLKYKNLVNKKGQILKKGGDSYMYSSVDKSLVHIIEGRKEKAPNGANRLREFIESDVKLKALLNLQQGGSKFKFAPKLWKRY